MEQRGSEQADRIADVLYAISRFVVAVCILPIAIWFATFALLETIISDFLVRVLVSSAVGAGLFGILLILTGKVHAGAIMLDLSILTSAVSLSILWDTLHSAIACAHGYFLATLLIFYFLNRRNSISQAMWNRSRFVLGILAISSGPIAICLTLLFYSIPSLIVYAILPASLVLYMIVLHTRVRDPRIGIVHSVLLGASSGLLALHLLSVAVGLLDSMLNISVFLLGCGIGLLGITQTAREIDKAQIEKEPEELKPLRDKWIIHDEAAHVLSGISFILLSLGSSPYFLWLARMTDYGLTPQFDLLFIPFSILISLLVLAPSPVFIRFAGKINRSRESNIIRGIGLLIVLLVSVTSFSWTQYFLWNFYISIIFTVFLFVMGLTGLFKRIRRLWRNLWLKLIRVLRAFKFWLLNHPVQFGIFVNAILSGLVVVWIYPTLSLYPDTILSAFLVFIAAFTLFGSLGLTGLRRLKKRNHFLSISWSLFLCTTSTLFFWIQVKLWSIAIVQGTAYSLLPLFLSIILLKIQVPRTRVAALYMPAVLSFSYLVFLIEIRISTVVIPFITISSLVLVLAPILYPEYSRGIAVIRKSLVAFGQMVSRGISFIGRKLLEIILISWAILIIFILLFVEMYVLRPILNLDMFSSLILLVLIFLIGYIPAPRRYGEGGSSLLSICVLGIALCLSSLVFISLEYSLFGFRILATLFTFSLILLLSRNIWPTRFRMFIAPTTWCLFLSIVSFLIFRILSYNFSFDISLLFSGLIFSIGLLPLEKLEYIGNHARRAYAILAIPIGACLTYLLTWNPFFSLFAAILFSLPVAHHYYNRFVRIAGATTIRGLRIFLIYAAIHLIFTFGLLGFILSMYIVQHWMPFFATYPVPLIPIALTFILIALVVWSPAIYLRRSERPIFIPILISVFTIILSLNLVFFIQHPDLIFSISLVFLTSSFILTLARNAFPSKIRQLLIPLTWCSLLFVMARLFFLSYSIILGDYITVLWSLLLLGLGMLPLSRMNVPRKVCYGLYIVITFPVTILLAIALYLGIPTILFLAFIIPIPVAYRYYIIGLHAFITGLRQIISGLRKFIHAIEFGLRITIAHIALYLVIAMGIASSLLSAIIVYLLYPFFLTYPIPLLPLALTFVLMLLLLWLPSFFVQSERNETAISVGLLLLCSALSINVVYLLRSQDVILSILAVLLLFGFLLVFACENIRFIDSNVIPWVLTIGSIILIGIYLMQVDIIMKALFIILSLSFLSAPFLNETQRENISYPLVTGSFLSIIFWNLFLFNYNPVLLIFGYLCAEAFFLSIYERIRTKYSWWTFASTLGVVAFILLEPLGIIAPIIGVFISLELIWATPDMEISSERYSLPFGIVRSFLVSLIVSSVIGLVTYNIFIVSEVFLFVFLVTLLITIQSITSETVDYVGSLAAICTLSALVFSLLYEVFQSYSLTSIYPSFMLIALFLYSRSRSGSYKITNWHMFSVIIASLVSMVWYHFYQSVESIILVIPTFVFTFLVFELKLPESNWKKKSELIPIITSLILLAEIVWVWHAIFHFTFTPILIFIGTGLILLSTILFPKCNSVDWFSFEPYWELVSVIASLCLVIFFSNWMMFPLELPADPLPSLGFGLIFYSLFTTPLVRKAEKSANLKDNLLIAHIEWIPAIIGFCIFGLEIGSILSSDIRLIFGFGMLGYSCAGLIYLQLLSTKPRSVTLPTVLSLATSLAVLYWVFNENSYSLEYLTFITIILWIIISLPVTLDLILSFVSWCKRTISENKLVAAFVFPLLFGILIGIYLSQFIPQILFLGLIPKSIPICVSATLLIPAISYFAGSHLFEEIIAQRLRKPTIALLGPGLLLSFLVMVFPESSLRVNSELILRIFLVVSLTLWYLSITCRSLRLEHLKRIFYGVAALAIAPIIFALLHGLVGGNLFYTIPGTILLILLIEAPLFSYQLHLLVKLLKDIGLLFATLVRKFNKFIQYLFQSYGFIAWIIFSIVFVSIFGIISYPFFSELLNMPIIGFLYIIPSFSFPTMLLGLMLLFIGIVRRKVKSSFGSVSSFLSVFGFGLTAFCGLYDNGYPYLAVAITILSICLLALIIRREMDIGDEYFATAWIPIPLSVTAILIYYLYLPAVTLEAQILAVLLSLFPAFCLYIASTYVKWIPKTLQSPLWIVLSLLSGSIAYLSSYLAVFPPLATIYLSVFIASIVMFPVTGKQMTHLFFAPLFFALTGFAFTFVFGEVYQNLLLALASALFFVSRFVKDKRDERPDLGYLPWLRVAILIALLVAVGVFVVSVLVAVGMSASIVNVLLSNSIVVV